MENQRAIASKWFRDAKFGLFVHWGGYSILGRGEWVMHTEKIPIPEYEKLIPQFNPTEFDAKEWIDLVKEAGMKYITITSKHHDGFCMFDSKLTDYTSMNSPAKRDIMGELVEECHRQDVKIFFYYSQLDWHHPDYNQENWQRYLEYYQGQVRELCTNYGEIGGIWFDGWWEKKENPDFPWDLEGTYKIIHECQPGALVGNNHHVTPFPDEDFQMFEQDLPGDNIAGFNIAEQSSLPGETCLTINNHWGYHATDQNHKSTEQLIAYLVGAVGRGANLLLNTGPAATGKIIPEHVMRLKEMGAWLRENGESIYSTLPGPFPRSEWGYSTWKDDNVYLHILNWPGEKLSLQGLEKEVKSVSILNGDELDFDCCDEDLVIHLPESAKNPVDTIVLLKVS